jgi:hypothetical protein
MGNNTKIIHFQVNRVKCLPFFLPSSLSPEEKIRRDRNNLRWRENTLRALETQKEEGTFKWGSRKLSAGEGLAK